MGNILHFVRKHRDILAYLFFGCVTTLVNFLVYYPLYNWGQLSGAWSNIIAWAAAVLIAFMTNKPFVFESRDWSAKTVCPEFIKFVGSRIGSGLLETLFIVVTVDWLLLDGNIMKLIASVFVMILNYISSKFLVFHK